MARITSIFQASTVSRRQFLKQAVGMAGLAALGAACVPAAPAPAPAAEEKVKLNLWWAVNPTTEGVVRVFQEKFPNIEIALGDLGEAVYGTPKYVTAVAAGKGPDIAYQNRHTFRQFASRNLYRPIEDLMS